MIRHDSGRFPRNDRGSRPSPAKLDLAFRSFEKALKSLRPEIASVPLRREDRGKGVCLDLSDSTVRARLAEAGWSCVDQHVYGRDVAEAFHKLAAQLDVAATLLDALRQEASRGTELPTYEREMREFRTFCQGLRIVGDGTVAGIVLRPVFSAREGFALDLRHPSTQKALKAKRFTGLQPQFEEPPRFLLPLHPSEGIAGAFHRLALLVGVDPHELLSIVRQFPNGRSAEPRPGADAAIRT